MHSHELSALQASVELTYACAVRVVDRIAVYLSPDDHPPQARTVVTFELEYGRECFAWYEPSAHDHPRMVLRSADNRTPQEAVRAVLHGWVTGVPPRPKVT